MKLANPNNIMSVKTTKVDDLTEKARSQLAQFAVEVPIEFHHRNGTGKIRDGKNQTDDEIVFKLNLNKGQITNKANTVAIVFEPELVKKGHIVFHKEIDTPAKSFDVNSNDDHTFHFGKGAAMIQDQYLEIIENIYDLDLRGDDLNRVLGNSDSDNYPIKVEDPEAETYMLIAPRILKQRLTN